MLTANAMPEHVRIAQPGGRADIHLAKPITAASLLGAIEQVLSTPSATGQIKAG